METSSYILCCSDIILCEMPMAIMWWLNSVLQAHGKCSKEGERRGFGLSQYSKEQIIIKDMTSFHLHKSFMLGIDSLWMMRKCVHIIHGCCLVHV